MKCAHCRSSEADNSWLVKACAADKNVVISFFAITATKNLTTLLCGFSIMKGAKKNLKFI